jgi:phospholipid/cholesterol/gamma-HCH transport system substrate-binding protein
MPRTTAILVAGALAVVAVGGVLALDDDYTVEVVMPAATNLVRGSAVQIDGEKVGKVEELETRDGKAVVKISLDEDHSPLHDGTTARIAWKATLGERILELKPGADSNPEMHDGALIEGTVDRVELDQVLAALDQPTRARLQSLLARLDGTFNGNEQDLRQTMSTAGPTVLALGEVLRAVGEDGPAIRSLVTRLRALTETAASRSSNVSATVDQFASTVDTVADERESLQSLLRALPGTIREADKTLDKVPGAVDEAVPLLEDLQPAVARLPGVARRLSPVLRDLRPTVAELRPTLAALDELLGQTPGLLAALESVAPQLGTAGDDLIPVLAHLRPYTPEAAGWISNWGSGAGNYDGNGHYLRAFAQEGGTSFNHNPGVMPPGVAKKNTRLPGEAEGQPWTDAFGSELR